MDHWIGEAHDKLPLLAGVTKSISMASPRDIITGVTVAALVGIVTWQYGEAKEQTAIMERQYGVIRRLEDRDRMLEKISAQEHAIIERITAIEQQKVAATADRYTATMAANDWAKMDMRLSRLEQIVYRSHQAGR